MKAKVTMMVGSIRRSDVARSHSRGGGKEIPWKKVTCMEIARRRETHGLVRAKEWHEKTKRG